MVSIDKFLELIDRPESTTLDFKRGQYKIINDNADIKTAEFIKDIISFSNTIRTETAYIILGISNENGEKELMGIDIDIDDAIFQEKVKDKVNPKPTFLYYTIKYENKLFGIFEIPITKYSEPITPVVKMKGLEVGKIYFRRGSSNAEAIGKEIILIDKWLDSLPAITEINNLTDEIASLLSQVTDNRNLLSNVMAEAYRVAKKYRLKDLEKFCIGELSGWGSVDNEEKGKYLHYRNYSSLIVPFGIEISPYYALGSNSAYDAIKNMEHVHERKIILAEPLNIIEGHRRRSMEIKDGLATYNTTFGKLFNTSECADVPITVVSKKDTFEYIYNNIKQKFIEELFHV